MRQQLQNLDDDETTVEFRDSTLPLSDTLRAMANAITGSTVTVRELLTLVGEQGLLPHLLFGPECSLTLPPPLPRRGSHRRGARRSS